MAIESSVLLDEIGRNLLSALQEDARLSYAELGRRVGLSPAATAERLRRLEESGIITGYRVEIDREALGLPVLAIVRDELRRSEVSSVPERAVETMVARHGIAITWRAATRSS
jgi:DNA-binding Lrp family transcriptional regulator